MMKYVYQTEWYKVEYQKLLKIGEDISEAKIIETFESIDIFEEEILLETDRWKKFLNEELTSAFRQKEAKKVPEVYAGAAHMLLTQEESKKTHQVFRVLIDENAHTNSSRDGRYFHGEYKTHEEAVSECKKVVDEFLVGAYKVGMSSFELLSTYKLYGEDPFIEGGSFSAWTYAEKRSLDIINLLSLKK